MKENKGFSLVELIIVIAIMAILIGVMAPQLIKYIEKTNVSSDVQLCDSVKTAITLAITDPNVIAATDGTKAQLDTMMTGNAYNIDTYNNDTEFTRAVIETLGFNPFTPTGAQEHMKSSPAKDSGIMRVELVNSRVYVWINHSDMSGKKQDNTAYLFSDLETSGVIYAD